jgi:hypothetical protein
LSDNLNDGNQGITESFMLDWIDETQIQSEEFLYKVFWDGEVVVKFVFLLRLKYLIDI